jgi:hypothetical protein
MKNKTRQYQFQDCGLHIDAEEQILTAAAGISGGSYYIAFPSGGRLGAEFAYIELVARNQERLELALDDFSAGAMNRALRAAVRSLVLKGRPRNVVSALSCPGAGAAYDTAYDEAGDNYDEDWITGRSVELCPALADQYRLIQAVGDNFNPRWRTRVRCPYPEIKDERI